MSDALPPCPERASEHAYEMGGFGQLQLVSGVVKKA